MLLPRNTNIRPSGPANALQPPASNLQPPASSLRSALLLFIFGFALGAVASTAQAPDLERSLRARVEEFYGLLQMGQYTKAEKYVWEDSRENFRNQERGSMLGFEVDSIKVDPDGKTATVGVKIQVFAPMTAIAVTLDRTSQWCLAEGTWYVVAPTPQSTPANLASLKSAGKTPVRPPAQLKFKDYVLDFGRIKSGETTTVRFLFTNVTDHEVTITGVLTGADCLTAKVAKKRYKPGESGELVVQFDSTGYDQPYAQTIVVKTDPGGLRTNVNIKGYIEPLPAVSSPEQGQKAEKKP